MYDAGYAICRLHIKCKAVVAKPPYAGPDREGGPRTDNVSRRNRAREGAEEE